MNPIFHNLTSNPQNNSLFSYKQPQKYQNNNINLNPIFPIQNNIGKDLGPVNYLDNYNNADNNKNFPFFQISPPPILPGIPNNMMPKNNIIQNSMPNTFLMNNNNTNININTKLNLAKEKKIFDEKNNKSPDAIKIPIIQKNEDNIKNENKNKQIITSENNPQSSLIKKPEQKVHKVLLVSGNQIH